MISPYPLSCKAGFVRATPWRGYARIADALRARLLDAVPGSPVPSEADVACEFGVARNTARRALAELEAEGMIVARPGRGRVIAGSEEPAAYRLIAADLRQQIASDGLKPGERIPSESELMQRYGVSRGTARQGVAQVEAAGLVTAVHGKGRFVTDAGRP
jgi:DNA-binding GntR family transcriptional regulator